LSPSAGSEGAEFATCTACSSGAHAVGDSFKLIARGDADVMICGGAEGAITPLSVGGFRGDARNSHPQRRTGEGQSAFERDRDGFVVGEGAGIVILEELGQALQRGAPILAEIVGYGMSGDAFHITAPLKLRTVRSASCARP